MLVRGGDGSVNLVVNIVDNRLSIPDLKLDRNWPGINRVRGLLRSLLHPPPWGNRGEDLLEGCNVWGTWSANAV